MTNEQKHLWEVDHSYYCNEGNYFSNHDVGGHYKTFAEFLSEFKDSDFDYNLLFRWDWVEGEDHDLPVYNGDDYYRNGMLKVFWIGQRKGLYRYDTVAVCRADEPAVIEFLKPRWKHMQELWAPFKPENVEEIA